MKTQEALRFKAAWYEILDQCDRNLKIDVIDAVMQYFFSGIEPSFADDGRRIAFGFIKADIDSARSRRKTAPTVQTSVPPAEVMMPVCTVDGSIEPDDSMPNEEEVYHVDEIVSAWNDAAYETGLEPVDGCKPGSERMRQLLNFLRTKGVETVKKVITLATDIPFFNGLNTVGFLIDFDWIFEKNNFDKILEMDK